MGAQEYLGVDPVSGKQRYATKSVRGGKREAQRVLNEMVVEAERGLSARTNATCGSHQALGEGERSHRQPLAIVQCSGEHFPSRVVVDVVAIEEADDDAGVEVDQSHSARKSSTSLVPPVGRWSPRSSLLSQVRLAADRLRDRVGPRW